MRWQLSEQLHCLELQGELRRDLLQELAEFMRRRAEVELEYSRGLDKLAERFASRSGRLGGSGREQQSFRKEPTLLSPLHCWAVLLEHTRQQSRESAALGEVLAGPLAQRLSHIAEDVGRIVKKSKDLVQQLQDKLLEVVSELQTTKKTYHAYHLESMNAETKLREAERQEEKRSGRSALPATMAASASTTTTVTTTETVPLRKSSLKKGGRLVEKRQAKFLEHKLKCTKARNEYLLSLASVNAAVSNYYSHDILDLMDDMEKEREALQVWKERVGQELDTVVAFWLQHSHDEEHGGFFTCLGRNGQVYDHLKYVWLQGRQVWMYCRLYRLFERFHRAELLDAAKAGGEFLLHYARVAPPGKKCAFVLTRDGRPVKVQRTIFSECFYTMAMNELWKVTGETRYQNEAVEMMDQIVHWVRVDPTGLGRPQLSGTPATEPMAVPMMLLSLVEQLGEEDEVLTSKYAELGDWCAHRILQHVQRDGKAVLENISEDGKELPGCLGRHQNPGHAIEAGWFLLQYAHRKGDAKLQMHIIDKFLLLPFHSGWDPEHGGLFYFQDVDGLCPTQLEWDMKLWWPHSEAMIAFLMAFSDTGDPALLQIFNQVAEYTFSHFHDPEFGEWFGYLNREGKVALNIKGGPFKGCFHVPRCLAMCEQILEALIHRLGPTPVVSSPADPICGGSK